MADENQASFETNGNPENENVEATAGIQPGSDQTSTPTPVQNPPNDHAAMFFQSLQAPAMDLLMTVSISADIHKQKIIDLAVAASEELRIMATEKNPLWVIDTVKQQIQVLNDNEYKKRFGPLDNSLEEVIRVIASGEPIELPNLTNNNNNDDQNGLFMPPEMVMENNNGAAVPLETEASRAIGVVNLHPHRLLNMFMDVSQWSSVFSNMVSRATSLGVLLTGEQENPNGVLQVIAAEFHVSSPLYQGREIYFARYCRQLAYDTWVVADVSLERVFPNPLMKCQKRPSGCLIQAGQDGVSKVTWVENNAVCYDSVQNLFSLLVASGVVFRADRWISTLESYCDRISIMERQISQPMMQNDKPAEELGGGGRETILKVAGRMVRNHLSNINSCIVNSWKQMTMSGAEDVFVRTSFNQADPGKPKGVAINVATSLWLPVPPEYIYDFLRDGSNLSKWDLLSRGRVTRDIMSFPTTRHPRCGVSVVLAEPAPNQIVRLYLQESFTDTTGSYVIFAPIDIFGMHHMSEGKSPDVVSILPSGFAIFPDGSSMLGENTIKGSILTVAFQIMDEELTTPEYLPPLQVLGVYNLIRETVSLIKASLLPKQN